MHNFLKLVRSQGPYSYCFVPEDCRDDGSEKKNEQVFSCESLHQKKDVCCVESGAKDRVEEVSWKQQPPKFHKVFQDSYFDFADEGVVASDLLFAHESELSQLFKMVLRYAGAAEMKEFLYFSHTHRTSTLQQKPIDVPIFAPERVFILCLFIGVQKGNPLPLYNLVIVAYNSIF